MFTCKNCNKIFSRKSNLEIHYMKIFPCKKVEINSEISETVINTTCTYCNKHFSTKFNLNKHQKGHCNIKKELDIKKEIDLDIMNKVKEIFELHLKNNTNVTNITNITNNNITNNNNIQVNIFSAGKEDLSRLTQEEILKICTSGTYYPIVAAEIIHCNDKYPEFQNFLISNLRSNTGLVFMNNSWVSKTQDEILSNIMQIDKKHVTNLIKDLKVDDKLQVKLESTKDEITSGESKEHQKSKIKSKLYNASKMVMKNKKSTDKIIEDE